jgi:outer membrane protein OmpA-like peptidoglycan-associated protein
VYYSASGTKFEPDAATVRDLRAAARTAARIELIGRTDGEKPSVADESVALKRVLAARKFLTDQGADPTRIFLQYASATDYTGDNSTAFGRSQNRRVDIHIE